MAVDDAYTKSLLHFQNRVWTFAGTAQIDTAQKPFATGGSLLLDGTGDYLTTADSADFDFGTENFTIDFWVRRDGTQDDYAGVISGCKSDDTGWVINFGDAARGTQNKIKLISNASGSFQVDVVGTDAIADATWTHIAFVRSGNTLTLYQGGVPVDTCDVTGFTYNCAGTGAVIGRCYTDSDSLYYQGWLGEVRITKGLARWTADFSGSLPSAAMTNPSYDYGYTKSLLHFDGADTSTTFTDTTGKAWSAGGHAQLDTTQKKFGSASLLLDGTDDYVATAPSADFYFGSDNFSVDFWVRFNTLPASNDTGAIILSEGNAAELLFRVLLYRSEDKYYWVLWVDNANYGWKEHISIATGTWYHVAFVRSAATTTTIYVDGTSIGSFADNYTIDNPNQNMLIGTTHTGGWPLNGWLDELRISKGIARWTANFTAPTSAYDYLETKSLLHFDEADGSTFTKDVAANWTMDAQAQFYDESGKVWTAAGDAQLDTSQKKWTASGLFNGISDYITTPASDDFTTSAGDFTIDCWVRFSELDESIYYTTAYQRKIGVGEIEFGYFYYSSGSWQLECYLTDQVSDPQTTKTLKAAVSLSIDIWYHVAFCRSGTDLYLFLSGDLVDSDTWTGTSDFKDSPFYIGAYGGEYDYFKGNIDEFRFSKGIARWTANFTPPTVEYGTSTEYSETLAEGASASELFDTNLEVLSESASSLEAFDTNLETIEESVSSSEQLTVEISTIITESATSSELLEVVKAFYDTMSENASSSEAFESALGLSISENATSAETFNAIVTKMGWLDTTTPFFTISAQTGINCIGEPLSPFPTLEAYTGLSLSQNAPLASIAATGSRASFATTESVAAFFRLYGHGVSYGAMSFEGLGPAAVLSSTGYIVPIGNLSKTIQMFLLEASLEQTKDFIYDPLWYVNEGRVGYIQQNSPFPVIIAAST